MSSALTRSVLRATRFATPRLRIQPTTLSAQRLHTSVRRWDEAKLATVEPTSTSATATQTATALEAAGEASTPSTTQSETTPTTTEPAATSTTAEQTTTAAPSEVVEDAEDAATKAAETDGVFAFDAWTRAGVHPDIVEKLIEQFPGIKAPTPAQLAFLLTIQRGASDVYFKDSMGRGKTFSVVLAALSLILNGKKALILVPTPHLARQVEDLCLRLLEVTMERPPMWTTLLPDEPEREIVEPLVIATPKTYLTSDVEFVPDWILVDEPDHMLGPLPPRHIDPKRLAHHPIFKHPPPLVPALDKLFNIRPPPSEGKRRRDGKIYVDQSRRRDIRTAWSSATMQSKLKSFVYRHGWVRSAADLNWTENASLEQISVRENMEAIAEQLGGVTDDTMGRKPEHYAIEVGPTGAMKPISQAEVEAEAQAASEARAEARMRREKGNEVEEKDDDEAVKAARHSPVFTEAVALLQATAPPPDGKYALFLPPSGASLKSLSDELEALGIPSMPLVPEAIAAGIAPPAPGINPVLIASRESLTGLHLPELHTVYLVNGLDVAGLSKNQRQFGGRGERGTIYARIAGRLGRLGTSTDGKPQRVISLLPTGFRERHALVQTLEGMGEALDEWKDVDLSQL